MVSSDLFMEGVSLMLFGMGFVFLFLTALVGGTSLMSRVVRRYFPESVVAAAAPAHTAMPAATAKSDDTELVAVITVAIRMHRDKQSRD